MSVNETSSIRFSVEESVWFKKGQEVSNLISVSLDPEITVQEHEDYVSIRGALVLTGEYYPSENDQVEEEEISLQHSSALRTVDEIVEAEGGVNTLSHRFPVDITIPANRIQSLDDVYVLVESFDYEIPKQDQLQLQADLSISGIINERVPSLSASENEVAEEADTDPDWEEPILTSTASLVREDNENQEPEIENELAADKFPAFFTEARKEPIKEEPPQQERVVTRLEDYKVEPTFATPPSPPQDKENQLQIAASREEEQDETQLEQQDEPRLEEQDVEVQTEEPVLEERDQIEEEIEEESVDEVVAEEVRTPQTPQIEMKGRTEDEGFGWNPKKLYTKDSSHVAAAEKVEEDSNQQEENNRPRPRSENALYLTKMLGSGEEDFSKLRMRIVQQGETLGSIAESYDLSPNQIIRMNGLEDDVIKEGQILYIPEYAGVE